MSDAKKVVRPLSPHLTVYRMPIQAITSILTRITGNALIVTALLVVWWLVAASTGPEYFAVADAFVTGWFGQLVFFLSLWGIWYHYLAGLRHLYYDAGRGLDVDTSEKLSWAVIIGSAALTFFTLLII